LHTRPAPPAQALSEHMDLGDGPGVDAAETVAATATAGSSPASAGERT